MLAITVLASVLNAQAPPPDRAAEMIDEFGIAKLSTLAKSGDRDAETALGYAYLFGKGVIRDPKIAESWLLDAAKRGGSEAAFHLGAGYGIGFFGVKDLKKSFSWYLKAAEAGDASAQLVVAEHYASGDAIEKNLATSREWLLKASQGGNTLAMVKFAHMNLEEGDNAKTQEALRWLNLAAQTDMSAQSALAYLFKDGRYVKKDLIQACKWFMLLVQDQYEQYKAPLEELERQMSKADISEAESLARKFIEKR